MKRRMEILQASICLAVILMGTAHANKEVPNTLVMYKQSVNLTCMNDHFDPDKSSKFNVEIMWLLPNGDLVKKTNTHERVVISEDGKHIKIKEVDDVDFGIYNCIIYELHTQNYIIVQQGVNVNGPYWGDLGKKYRTNMIVGAIAAAVVCLLMIGMCYCINHGQTLDKDEEERMKAIDLWKSNTQGVDNMGIEMGEDIETKKVPSVNGDTPPPVYSEPNTESNVATKL